MAFRSLCSFVSHWGGLDGCTDDERQREAGYSPFSKHSVNEEQISKRRKKRDQWTSQRTRGYRCKRSVLDAFYTTDLDFGRRNRRQLAEGEVKEEGRSKKRRKAKKEEEGRPGGG